MENVPVWLGFGGGVAALLLTVVRFRRVRHSGVAFPSDRSVRVRLIATFVLLVGVAVLRASAGWATLALTVCVALLATSDAKIGEALRRASGVMPRPTLDGRVAQARRAAYAWFGRTRVGAPVAQRLDRVPWHRLPQMLLMVGAALLAQGCWASSTFDPFLFRIPAARIIAAPLDTMIISPAYGRYTLELDFRIGIGSQRRELKAVASMVAVDYRVNSSPSVSGRADNGTSSSGESYALIVDVLRLERRDTLRISARATPELSRWTANTPMLQLAPDFATQMRAEVRPLFRSLAGLCLMLIGAVRWWRRSRAARATEGGVAGVFLL
jgi:hypothetical protein